MNFITTVARHDVQLPRLLLQQAAHALPSTRVALKWPMVSLTSLNLSRSMSTTKTWRVRNETRVSTPPTRLPEKPARLDSGQAIGDRELLLQLLKDECVVQRRGRRTSASVLK